MSDTTLRYNHDTKRYEVHRKGALMYHANTYYDADAFRQRWQSIPSSEFSQYYQFDWDTETYRDISQSPPPTPLQIPDAYGAW